MSKGNSGLFSGTKGANADIFCQVKNVISARTANLNLNEYPRLKSFSAKQRKNIANKIKARTATKQEYLKYNSDRRFSKRRQEGVKQFWIQEKMRILSGQAPTRQWSKEQIKAILNNERPKYKGKTIQGHHMYSANRYPHLANKGSVIFPVTFNEHLYGWHGGNFKNSLPGHPINKPIFYNFSGGKKND